MHLVMPPVFNLLVYLVKTGGNSFLEFDWWYQAVYSFFIAERGGLLNLARCLLPGGTLPSTIAHNLY